MVTQFSSLLAKLGSFWFQAVNTTGEPSIQLHTNTHTHTHTHTHTLKHTKTVSHHTTYTISVYSNTHLSLFLSLSPLLWFAVTLTSLHLRTTLSLLWGTHTHMHTCTHMLIHTHTHTHTHTLTHTLTRGQTTAVCW